MSIHTFFPYSSLIKTGRISTPFGQIGYRSISNKETQEVRPLIVFFHQTPSTSVMFESLMLSLADLYDCLALDTPGFGASETHSLVFNQTDHIFNHKSKSKSLEEISQGLTWAVCWWIEEHIHSSSYSSTPFQTGDQTYTHSIHSVPPLILCGHHTGVCLASWLAHHLADPRSFPLELHSTFPSFFSSPIPSSPSLILIGPPSIPTEQRTPFLDLTLRLQEHVYLEEAVWGRYFAQDPALSFPPLSSNQIYHSSSFLSSALWIDPYIQNLVQALKVKDSNLCSTLAQREIYLRGRAGIAYPRMYQAVWDDSLLERLMQVQGRVFLLGGEKDLLNPYMSFALDSLIHAESVYIKQIKGAGGYLCETHTDQVSDLIQDFIKKKEVNLG